MLRKEPLTLEERHSVYKAAYVKFIEAVQNQKKVYEKTGAMPGVFLCNIFNEVLVEKFPEFFFSLNPVLDPTYCLGKLPEFREMKPFGVLFGNVWWNTSLGEYTRESKLKMLIEITHPVKI